MSNISVFYDPLHPGIYIVGLGVVYPTLSLMAVQNVNGSIEIWTQNSTSRLVGPVDYSRIANRLGSGFTSSTDAYNYLVSQFTQQPPSTGGGTTANTYIYTFSASSIWTVGHNLNTYPSVTLLDTTGAEFDADVKYDNPNQITITMSAASGGTVCLNCGVLVA